MRSTTIFLITISAISLLMSGCGGPVTTPTGGTNNAAANAANGNSTNPLATNAKPPEATTNAAPTLAPVYKAYCAAWVKKDEAALRKAYSAESLKEIEKQMKDEKIKSLVEFFALDKLSNELCEVDNEDIKGDTATARIHTKAYPNGIPIIFKKENGVWKLTTKSPTFDAMKPTAGNSNAAK